MNINKDISMLVGRAVKSRKARVDEVHRFDIKHLMAGGVLSQKDINIKTCALNKGKKSHGEIGFQILYDENDEPKAMRFLYSVRLKNTGEQREFDYRVSLVASPCHLGGKRWWFICPLEKNGAACGRRCSILYLPGNYHFLGCRVCYELTYQSRQRHRDGFYECFEKPNHRIEKAEKELKKAKSIDSKLLILKAINENQQIIHKYNTEFCQDILRIIN